MSFFDDLSSIGYQVKRFLWPVIFLVTGIVLLNTALVPRVETLNNGETLEVPQSALFMYAALLFMVGSVVWFLYLFGLIKTMIGYGVMVLMVGISGYVLWQDFSTIKTDVDYNDRYEKADKDIQARMGDLKSAQIAYKEFNGTYTNSVDDLIDFVKNGKKMTILKMGSVPERKITPEERDLIYGDDRPIDKLMTETEAHAIVRMSETIPTDLEGFRRDTSYVPVMEAIFENEKYIENREKTGCLLAFHPDSLKYVPYSSLMVEMDTASVEKGELKVPTLQINMQHPMDTAKMYQIGDINDNHLRENWKK